VACALADDDPWDDPEPELAAADPEVPAEVAPPASPVRADRETVLLWPAVVDAPGSVHATAADASTLATPTPAVAVVSRRKPRLLSVWGVGGRSGTWACIEVLPSLAGGAGRFPAATA
jgi:hypothetical protein